MHGLPLRRLQFIGTGVSDYLDFVLDAEAEEAALEAILDWLYINRERWDLVDLQQLSEDSPTSHFWRERRLPDGLLYELIHGEVCPYMPLPASWEELSSRLGKKMCWNLRYYERLIRREFEVEMCALTEAELGEGIDAFFRLHTLRWRKRWLPGVLAGSRIRAFHREVAWLFAKRGWLRLHGLRLNDQLHAVLYCFVYGGKGYYYLGGFEPSLSRYSLGTVLTGFAIREAIELGCSEFDFLRGDEGYKSRWKCERRTNFRATAVRATTRSKASAMIACLERWLERRGKVALHNHFGAG
jgi:CelD/BcsL family acetyltransferase involved in cellulose biosynthesis